MTLCGVGATNRGNSYVTLDGIACRQCRLRSGTTLSPIEMWAYLLRTVPVRRCSVRQRLSGSSMQLLARVSSSYSDCPIAVTFYVDRHTHPDDLVDTIRSSLVSYCSRHAQLSSPKDSRYSTSQRRSITSSRRIPEQSLLDAYCCQP